MAAARKWPWQATLAIGIVLGILLLAGLGVWLAVQRMQPSLVEPSEQLMQAARRLDEITIDAKLDAENHNMAVRQVLMLTNDGEEPRDAVVLRTWPNAFQKPDTSPIAGNSELCPEGFSAGSLVMEESELVRQDGATAVAHRYLDEAKTVLSLPLEAPWQPGEQMTVVLKYTVHFPHAQYRFGWWENTVMAGQTFAMPALWQDGAYRTDAYLPIGDPLSGECVNIHLSLTLPKGYTCGVTGQIIGVQQSPDGTSNYLVEALAVREVGLVMGSDLHVADRTVNGTLVEALAAKPAEAKKLLNDAADALETFSKLYGAYPYPTYTACAVPMGVSGAEYPGMVMIAQSLLEDDELEYTVAHETAHQWWYGLVGSDSSTHPWLDEALCEFSLLEYVEDRHGKAAREELRKSRVESAMRVTVAGQATPGAPLDYFETSTDYMVLVYGRATSLLCAMDDWLNGQLDQVLRRYAETYAFSMADREAFTRLVQEETGLDVEPLMVDYLDTYLLN